MNARVAAVPLASWFALTLAGCGAVYPEITSPLKAPPAGITLEPPPPKNLVYIGFKEGQAPERTRDGRAWHELGSKLPDPFAILFVNGKELIKTNPQSSTLTPTWPDAPKGNYRIEKTDKLRVEMWQSGLVNAPMCVKDLGSPDDEWLAARQVTINCPSGARVVLHFAPAEGQLGYGFYFELRTQAVYVSRVFEESPAARAKLEVGDQILAMGDKPVKAMSSGEMQSYVNAGKVEGIKLQVKKRGGETVDVELKEGGVYPLFSETATVAK